MKISGFTIIRNAVLNDYPVVEAIRSILPVVDEMVVSVGNSRRWYGREVRVIRNDAAIRSYKANGEKLRVKPANASVYHYGWVKNPQQMLTKMKNLGRFWAGDASPDEHPLAAADVFNFDDYDSLEVFRGTHPAVMQERIARQNWQVDIDVSKKRFDKPKYRLLYWVEKLTGKRFFEFRNFRLV